MNLEDFERVCMILDNTLIHAILYTFLSPFAYIISFDVNYWWWVVGGGKEGVSFERETSAKV